MKAKYTEPTDYIPEDIRKKLKIGEYAEPDKEEKEKRDLNKKLRNFVNDKK